jgi:hypothetical protein
MDPFTLALVGGSLASSLGGLFGGKAAAKKQAAAIAEAQRQANIGYDKADATASNAYGEAAGYFEGDRDTGIDARDRIRDATGLNGTEAQNSYAQGIYSNPLLQGASQFGLNRVLAQKNALGQGRSGAAQLAANRAMQENAMGFENNMYSRLNQLYGVGQNASSNMANIAQNRGQTQIGLQLGRAGVNSNAAGQQGQIAAQSAAAPWNALASFGNTMSSVGSYGMGRNTGGGQNALMASWPGTQANGGWSTTVNRAGF